MKLRHGLILASQDGNTFKQKKGRQQKSSSLLKNVNLTLYIQCFVIKRLDIIFLIAQLKCNDSTHLIARFSTF